ncbi:MAG: type III-A CRISPR-associated RAMP protein Csm5 [Deltaproteobacteria bacterium]|nr:type III-A CRISPR-associated RAMP protein Csm5 [Deltaproteobacteria bacterium]
MNNKEIRRFHLRILTPTHIGTREGFLQPMEFAVHQGKVYVCDDDLLGQVLLEKGLLARFLAEVERGPLSIKQFFASAGLRPEQVLPQISRLTIPLAALGGEEPSQFRPFIRDGQGEPFLPGSALKGVFRTAVLYQLLKDSAWQERLVALVSRHTPCTGRGKEWRRSTVFFSEELLQKQALQKFPLRPGHRCPDPTTDLLRCLTVRDAYPVEPGSARTYVIPVDFLCRGRGNGFYFSQTGYGRPLRVWVEALFQTTFAVEVIWDHGVFAHFQQTAGSRSLPVTGLDDLLEAVQTMNRDLIDHERRFYAQPGTVDPEAAQTARSLADFYGRLSGNLLRVGFGSGMLSTTVNLHLPPELRQKVRDRCGSGPRPEEEAPKSRRIWRDKKGRSFPLGWTRLRPPEEG